MANKMTKEEKELFDYLTTHKLIGVEINHAFGDVYLSFDNGTYVDILSGISNIAVEYHVE